MNSNELNQNQAQGFFMVPAQRLIHIENLLVEIKENLQSKLADAKTKTDYVDEKQACAMLGRKATWFWMLRRDGKIHYSKVGSKVFYPISEINRLLTEG